MKSKARKESKVGRPTKAPTPGERIGMSLRVTPELKDRLDRTAQANGRSLSQEAEIRLEQSFRNDDLLPQLMEATYGAQLAGVLRILGRAISATANRAARDDESGDWEWNWLREPWAFDQVSKAVEHVMKAIRPEGNSDSVSHGEFGVNKARDILGIVSMGHRSEDIQHWVESVSKSIGSELVKRIRQRIQGA